MIENRNNQSIIPVITICTGIVALISFFLPLIKLSFIYSASAYELMSDDENVAIGICFFCTIFGLISSIFTLKWPYAGYVTAILNLAGIILMIIAFSENEGAIEYASSGFYIYLCASIASIALPLSAMRLLKSPHRTRSNTNQQNFNRSSYKSTQPNDSYRFFRCPACGAMLRVPGGKGLIRIKCRCGNILYKDS